MKSKNAFSLAEVLIVLFIIGVISVFAVYTVTNYDKGIRYLYSNTYHNIDKALYNAFNFSDIKNPFAETEVNESGSVVSVSPGEGARRLCQMLTEYINAVNVSCTDSGLAQTDGVNFGTPKFQSLNGTVFYISSRLPEEGNAKKRPGDHTFFLIYVDLNGEKKPNSMDYAPPSAATHNRPVDPDVFAFAALDTGRVCPLGPPEVDPRYMKARVAYQGLVTEGQNGQGDELNTRFSVNSKPYHQTKAEAWGYYKGGDDRQIIEGEPTSYNTYIRDILPENTKIYSFLNGAPITVPENIHQMSGTIQSGEYECTDSFSDEKCQVIVDRYLF